MKSDIGSSRRGRRAMNEINVVPYIDVMLVLLVIFMVTAPIVTPGSIDLPTVGKVNQSKQEPPLEVNIKADGSYSLRDKKTGQEQSITLASMGSAVKDKLGNGSERAVVIAADKSVKYEKVVEAMDELQKASVARVGLLVKPTGR